MKKMIPSLLAVAAIVAGGFAILQTYAASEAKRQIEALAAEALDRKHALDQALKELQSVKSELESARSLASRFPNGERDAVSKKIGDETPRREPGDEGKKNQDAIRSLARDFAKRMDTPEMRQIMRANQTRMAARAYGRFFDEVKLSEADQQLVGELIADRNMEALDKARVLMGGDADEAAVKKVREEILTTKSEYDARLKSVIGEEGFANFSSYEQTLGDQRALDFFSRNFENKNVPLEKDQMEMLRTVMTEERLKQPRSEIPDLSGGPGMELLYTAEEASQREQQEAAYQQSVINRASQGGLSPDQANVLRDSFKQREEFRKMGRTMGRAFLGGFGAPPPRPTP